METKAHIQELLPQAGAFYKANLHTHTTLSDGRFSPEKVKEVYRQAGYQVVAFTDHGAYHDQRHLTDETFVAICGLEVDVAEQQPWPRPKVYHMNFLDTDPDIGHKEKGTAQPQEISPWQERLQVIGYEDTEGINQYIADATAAGYLVFYNHPYWSLQDYRDYAPLRGLFGMEIYNYGCEHDGLYGGGSQVYDEMLREGQKLYCLATDDNHNRSPLDSPSSDSFGGFTMIKATELSYDGIIRALQAGHFYASTGPSIHELYLEGNEIVVRCSPVEKIYATCSHRGASSVLAAPGETLTEARLAIPEGSSYFRINCRDHRGQHAYSNAYFIEDLK